MSLVQSALLSLASPDCRLPSLPTYNSPSHEAAVQASPRNVNMTFKGKMYRARTLRRKKARETERQTTVRPPLSLLSHSFHFLPSDH